MLAVLGVFGGIGGRQLPRTIITAPTVIPLSAIEGGPHIGDPDNIQVDMDEVAYAKDVAAGNDGPHAIPGIANRAAEDEAEGEVVPCPDATHRLPVPGDDNGDQYDGKCDDKPWGVSEHAPGDTGVKRRANPLWEVRLIVGENPRF